MWALLLFYCLPPEIPDVSNKALTQHGLYCYFFRRNIPLFWVVFRFFRLFVLILSGFCFLFALSYRLGGCWPIYDGPRKEGVRASWTSSTKEKCKLARERERSERFSYYVATTTATRLCIRVLRSQRKREAISKRKREPVSFPFRIPVLGGAAVAVRTFGVAKCREIVLGHSPHA